MKGKTVLVTGASSGIGRMTAIEYAKLGANLILTARRQPLLAQLANEIQGLYQVKVDLIVCDLSKQEEIDQMINELHAIGKIDVLVQAAGFGIFKRVVDFTDAELRNQIEVNLLGSIALTRALLSHDLLNDQGHLFYLASIAGKIATPSSSVYSASKAGLIAFCRGLRMELLQRQIRVTVINPGPVRTPFFSYSEDLMAYYERVQKWAIEPDKLAKKISSMASQRSRINELNLPWMMSLSSKLVAIFPKISDWLIVRLFDFKEK